MKKKTAVLTAGFLSLGVLVLASNMIVDGREVTKGKTIPYTLEITLPENAADGSMICFQQASQESGESKDSEDKAHENASGNLVIGYNQDTGRPSVFFTGEEEIILNEKNELVWKDCRQPVILTDKIQVVSTPDYNYRFLMKDAEGREQILSFSYAIQTDLVAPPHCNSCRSKIERGENQGVGTGRLSRFRDSISSETRCLKW